MIQIHSDTQIAQIGDISFHLVMRTEPFWDVDQRRDGVAPLGTLEWVQARVGDMDAYYLTHYTQIGTDQMVYSLTQLWEGKAPADVAGLVHNAPFYAVKSMEIDQMLPCSIVHAKELGAFPNPINW